MPMGNSKVEKMNECRSMREACASAQIRRLTSLAGGLGACYALSGEREGRSPLACAKAHLPR
jgi:hypothetical protein